MKLERVHSIVCVKFFRFMLLLLLLWSYSHVKQPTAEQLRIAQITEISSGSDDPKLHEKVSELMEMTQRTEEEACFALNECEFDMDRAVEYLFEQLPVVSKSIPDENHFAIAFLLNIFSFN